MFPYRDPSNFVAERVEDLLSRLPFMARGFHGNKHKHATVFPPGPLVWALRSIPV